MYFGYFRRDYVAVLHPAPEYSVHFVHRMTSFLFYNGTRAGTASFDQNPTLARQCRFYSFSIKYRKGAEESFVTTRRFFGTTGFSGFKCYNSVKEIYIFLSVENNIFLYKNLISDRFFIFMLCGTA